MTCETEILCGIHSVLEALKAKRRTFFKIYISKERNLARLNEILELAKLQLTQVEFISANELDRISNRVKHQGIVAKVLPLSVKKAEVEIKNLGAIRLNKNSDTIFDKKYNNSIKIKPNRYEIEPNTEAKESKKKFIVVLEGIEDTHNLGAIIRTAICAGVDHIIIPKDRAVQPSPAVSRISAGAMEHADIWIATNITSSLKLLKKEGFWVAGLDADGETPLFRSDLTDNIVLVIGGEHQGIRPLVKKECDFLLSLPLASMVTSLNASVACGIAIYEVVRQRGLA
ncbi:MAG: 23S rRNA (guanosine(2251)-2'-O)-methyltransferase RlmB [Desulfamplus sp.]|nr:23S rRNA (guanosine(2251)-2'-O)-methyltransferase RlmB [Desulfamplus sp.]